MLRIVTHGLPGMLTGTFCCSNSGLEPSEAEECGYLRVQMREIPRQILNLAFPAKLRVCATRCDATVTRGLFGVLLSEAQ